ncbi:unnamed protein product (macronuclear) [Paramecium tetraurelia]|uniref:Uncharacterized protein n=1 Tax=Paramecium tetraurelia TaxID=5888 RepID=A0D1I0_PARTE|nr:uncharacterized protein GSPATT00012421001 [Paramecium tetraurelia]CAK76897.1 unnamed protein product [Paramecium tetraurelia]|eukprot:XP_001444294.1 hypothetical protein (macronuclear) [Paramecium tetraurelia strain d4-2]
MKKRSKQNSFDNRQWQNHWLNSNQVAYPQINQDEKLKAQLQASKTDGKADPKNDKNKSPQKGNKDQKEKNPKDQNQGKNDKKDTKAQDKTDPKQKKK